MKLAELIDKLELEIITADSLDREVKGVYIGDLLSNVMAKAEADMIWITIQGHQNVVAVALLTGVTAVIVAEDFQIEEAAIKRAREEGVNLLRSPKTAYQLASELAKLGI
ncbi:MAG: serine kinase [Halanaerobiaceae bacterium]|jgi:serine kinase of HPr protein (carbohydrate metabolism regulator)|nr:serine kinase [Halanaerobiaceae bacterium]